MRGLLLTCFLFVGSFCVIYSGFKYLASFCDLIVDMFYCSKTRDTFTSITEESCFCLFVSVQRCGGDIYQDDGEGWGGVQRRRGIRSVHT